MSETTSDDVIADARARIRDRMKLAEVRLAVLAAKRRAMSELRREIEAIEEELKLDSETINGVMKALELEQVVVGNLLARAEYRPEYTTFFTRVHNLSQEIAE